MKELNSGVSRNYATLCVANSSGTTVKHVESSCSYFALIPNESRDEQSSLWDLVAGVTTQMSMTTRIPGTSAFQVGDNHPDKRTTRTYVALLAERLRPLCFVHVKTLPACQTEGLESENLVARRKLLPGCLGDIVLSRRILHETPSGHFWKNCSNVV